MTDVVVEQGRWAPVSAGEYDRRTRTVSVNLALVDAVVAAHGHASAAVIAAIVAHERVHVLSTPGTSPHAEEARARAAAIEVAGPDVVGHIDEVLSGAWA